MTFHPGQKVVCISVDVEPRYAHYAKLMNWSICPSLKVDGIYTVVPLRKPDDEFVSVDCCERHMGFGWYKWRFRPLTERKNVTSIEDFKKLLTTEKVPELV